MKLSKFMEIKGSIVLESGLHIGAGNDEVHIGGIDSPVIKNLLNNQPYIPGSSIKGKIRCLLEQVTDRIETNKKDEGVPFFSSGDDLLCRMFGNGKSDTQYKGGPTRLVFSDCNLLNAELLRDHNALTEAKYEVVINRKTGTAAEPRQIERVPAGAEFEFRVVVKVFDTDDAEQMRNFLKLGLKLLEIDCLGGGGSRGYGRVSFKNLKEGDSVFNLDGDIGELIEKFTNKV